jgi:pilus assembly protein CpaB
MIIKRSQMNPRNVTLLLAAVLALGTGLLLFNYLSGVNLAANKVEAKRVVLVAAHLIPAQTVISADMLDRAVRPAASVEPDSVDPVQMESVVGTVALVAIPAGGTLTQSRIARPSAVSLTAKVKVGLRAVTIPIDHVKGVAGLIQTGDRVDVIAIQSPRGDLAPSAHTILRGINVLAMGMTFQPTTGASPAPDAGNQTTATLEVTPQQADLLALADINTVLRLALRSPREPVHSLPAEPISFVNPAPMMAAAPPAARLAPPATLLPAARLRPSGPIIIDGDKIVGDDKK